MITKIEQTSRMGDSEQSVLDMYTQWVQKCTEELSRDYPEAEIKFIKNNDCGCSEIYVECDDAERNDVERDVQQTLRTCWDILL